MNGDILKELRQSKGLTQQELGDLVGISASNVRMIEKNQRNGSLDVVSKLADYFNVSIDYLEGKTNYKNSTEIATNIINKLIELNIINNVNEINDNILNIISDFTNKTICENKTN
ncbi:helix-turn-helix domain-containing protein [Clostridium perfringens]